MEPDWDEEARMHSRIHELEAENERYKDALKAITETHYIETVLEIAKDTLNGESWKLT